MDHLELHLHDETEEPNLDQLTRDADLKWLMGTPQGPRIVRGLFDRTGLWRMSFTGEPLSSAFREGERNVGLGLLARLMRAAPEETARLVAGQDAR